MPTAIRLTRTAAVPAVSNLIIPSTVLVLTFVRITVEVLLASVLLSPMVSNDVDTIGGYLNALSNV
jgi:hypothetical protein